MNGAINTEKPMQTQSKANQIEEKDDWTLTTDQMFFLMQRHNPILEAYTHDDMTYLDSIENSDEYRALFDNMSFDEAFDRYECTLEADGEDA
jgi:hypothetical protein